MNEIVHASLFSGGGGFDLAAQWMGYKNLFHCEWMPFPRYILDYHFPESDSHENIITTDFKQYANKIDILTGGFPCQPFSLAGKRKGTDDERYLWHEMLRAIQEIKPKCVIAENVYGLTNIDGGLVFESVCLDLENEGYEVQPFIIPACAKNAPHRRDRVWIVAYCNVLRQNRYITGEKRQQCRKRGQTFSEFDGNGRETVATNSESLRWQIGRQKINGWQKYFGKGYSIRSKFTTTSKGWSTTNPNGIRFARQEYGKKETERPSKNGTDGIVRNSDGTKFKGQHIGQQAKRTINRPTSGDKFDYWQNFPTQSPICGGDDGVSTELDGTAFLESTGKKVRNFKSYHRSESIKIYGNAIVPQVAMELFKLIEPLIKC